MEIQTILVVDDDSVIRRIAEITLSRVGKWKVVTAESGARALELVSTLKPDLILLDVMMPGMDGPSTFAKIKDMENPVRMPVIFLTAKVQKQEVEEYLRLGAAGVLSKPFDPLSLPQEIIKLFDKAVNTSCSA